MTRGALVLGAAIVAALASACGDAEDRARSTGDSDGASLRSYAEDPAARRAALEGSLVTPDNGYSRLRLERYTEARWGALPEWNPRVRVLRSDDGGRAPPADASFAALDVDGVAWTKVELVALGKRAFYTYPAQLAPGATMALGARTPGDYGLWDDAGRVGGLVWTELPDGSTAAAFTCSTCHASREGASIVAGRNAADVRIDRLLAPDASSAPEWGPGRVDPTSDGVDNPTAIPDLRPIRWQKYLHRDATLRNSLVGLAVRIETLVVTAHNESVRPPRKIAAALAMYLWSLADDKRAPPERASDGARVFDATCAGCHAGEGATGEPIALAAIGTDPIVGQSPERGTGRYRVPSLRFVGDRHRLFANGAVEDTRALLDPARRAPGHRYGLDLSEHDRTSLLAYLSTL